MEHLVETPRMTDYLFPGHGWAKTRKPVSACCLAPQRSHEHG